MINKLLMVFITIKPIGAIAIALLAFFLPIAGIIHGLLVLVFMDLVTGIIAHFKQNKIKFQPFKYSFWKHITSKGIGDTISKMLVYLILVISGFMIDMLIIPNAGLLITKIMGGAAGLREIKSIIENSEKILGAGLITFIRAVSKYGFTGAFNEVLKEKEKDDDNITDNN